MRRLILLISLLFIAATSNSQTNAIDTSTIIHIRHTEVMADSFMLILSPHYMVKSSYGLQVFSAKAGAPGSTFKLHGLSKVSYGFLRYYKDKKVDDFLPFEFPIEPGDKILIDVKGGYYEVSGNGSAKIKALLELSKINDFYSDPTYTSMNDAQMIQEYGHSMEFHEKANKYQDALLHSRMSMLEKYKDRLTPFAYELMRTDIKAEYDWKHIENANLSLTKAIVLSEVNRKSALKRFRERFGSLDQIDTTTSEAKSYSRNYAGNLLKLIQLHNILIASNYDLTQILNYNRFDFPKETFNFIQMHFARSVLKDKMFAQILVLYGNKDTTGAYFNIALNNVASSFFHGFFTTLKNQYRSNGQFFPISLPTSQGSYFTNKLFEGKVTLIDYWYTGCSGCAQAVLHLDEPMTKLKLKYKNFQTLSISIDTDSLKWRNSLKGGKYSFNGSINAWAPNVKFSVKGHPLINYYNISAYPRLMIVGKKGELISFMAPRDEMGLIKIIEKELNR